MNPRDLYGLPLERFTAERNALAKQLRGDDRRDQAAEVSKLRKPSVAAWAVNQLIRTQAGDVKRLFKAGDALQRAQRDLLAGRGGSGELREALAAERASLDHLTDKARGLLSSDGHGLTPARLEQVSETLHAAALDEDARARVRDGCLDRELRHTGLGALEAAGRSESRATRQPRKSVPKSATRRKTGQNRKASDERAARLKTARTAEAEARRRGERAARELKTAQAKRDNAADALRDADESLAAASSAAEQAAQELRATQRAVKDLTQ